MPPLGTEYVPRERSPESKELERELDELKTKATKQVLRIFEPVGHLHHKPAAYESEKAIYQCDGQTDDVWTRAWLEGSESPTTKTGEYLSCTLELYTDVVKVEGDDQHRIPGSRKTAYIKVTSRKIETTVVNNLVVIFPDYNNFDDQQRIEFMRNVLETLDAIEQVSVSPTQQAN